MDLEKQKILLQLLLNDQSLFATCQTIIKPSYFDPALKKFVSFCLDYFNQYKNVPPAPIVKAETGVVIEPQKISKDEFEYASNQIERFCRNKAIEAAIRGAPELLRDEDFGKIEMTLKEAISVSLNKDLGTDYFKNPEIRLKRLLDSSVLIPTYWQDVDNILGGGVGRQELLLFAANSGVGKSIVMQNLAVNLLAQGLNGIYITLELSEDVVAKRFDSMITGIAQADITKNIANIASDIESIKEEMGKFKIKRLPENATNSNDVRAYVKKVENTEGWLPDFIVVDYLDLMSTNQKIGQENLFIKDKFVAEEVRALGWEFDALMISASQLGRSAIEAEKLNQGHIQGGISKINTCDNAIAIIQNEQQRALGEYWFEFLKTRNSNGVGKKIVLLWDGLCLRISNKREEDLSIKKRVISQDLVIHDSGTVLDKINKSRPGILNVLDAVEQISEN